MLHRIIKKLRIVSINLSDNIEQMQLKNGLTAAVAYIGNYLQTVGVMFLILRVVQLGEIYIAF